MDILPFKFRLSVSFDGVNFEMCAEGEAPGTSPLGVAQGLIARSFTNASTDEISRAMASARYMRASVWDPKGSDSQASATLVVQQWTIDGYIPVPSEVESEPVPAVPKGK